MNILTFEEAKIGDRAVFSAKVTRSMIEGFVRQSGDNNPLHTDGAYAYEKGFAEPVVHGLLLASYYSTLAGVHLPGKYCIIQGIDVDFHHPLYAEQEFEVTGEIVAKSEGVRRVEVKARMRRKADDKLISKAVIRIGFLA